MKYKPIKHNLPKVMVRKRLLEAAYFEFSNHGYVATNPETITKRVGINRVAFYSHFKNKNEILMHLIRELMDELSELMKDKRAHKLWMSADDPDEFEQPVLYITEILSNSSGLIRAFVQGMMEDEKFFKLYDQTLKQYVRIFRPRIKSIQKSGRYQGCDATVLSQIMAISFLMSIFSLSIETIRCTPAVLAKTISQMFFAFLNFNERQNKLLNSNDPKSEKSRKTKSAILAAARQEFAVHGVTGTTIERIAKRAGFSRGTVYLYYKKKEDIVDHLESKPLFLARREDIFVKADDDTTPAPAKDPKSKPKKSTKTRDTILAAARHEFEVQGYFDTTIEAIAKRAECSRSTLYLYFKKKDDLVRAILQEMLAIFNPVNLSDPLLDSLDTTSIDELLGIITLIIDIFEKYSVVNWALLQGFLYSDELADNYKALYNQFSAPVSHKIDNLKGQGKCRGVDAVVASRIIITNLSYSASMYNSGIIKCSKQELAMNMAKFLHSFFNFT